MIEKVNVPENLANAKIPWGPIGKQVYDRSYSHTLSDGTKETWPHTVVRVIDGNLGLVSEKHIEKDEREKLIKLLMPFSIIPAGRHLYASGLKGRQFLFNCLSGDTRVKTKNGLVPIRDLAGKEVEVLTQGSKEKTGVGCWTYGQGVWRKAKFSSFGVQDLLKVTFSDGSEIFATEDHKWYVTKRVGPVETKNLEGLVVPFVLSPKPERDEAYAKAVVHGFVYGDGTVSVNNGKTYSANVQMFAEKDRSLQPWFERQGFSVTHPSYCDAYVGRMPSEFKSLPPDGSSPSYWLGFINGLIAADGTVDKQGCVFLYQADKAALETIRLKAMEVGFATTPLVLQREKNPWTGEDAALWRLCFRRFSVTPLDLVLDSHRVRFEEIGDPTISGMTVVSVTKSDRKEEVFCAVEPETHTFVIENSILTGNCHASGYDPLDPSAHFSFLFDELMQGGGVGANYSNRYMESMPAIVNSIDPHIVCRDDHPDIKEFETSLSNHNSMLDQEIIVIDDSREGWVEAVDLAIKRAYSPNENGRKEVSITFDVSNIRRRGSPLKTSGGIACGPGPLVSMLLNMIKILNGCVGRKLSSLDTMMIDHSLADCVIAGGKRRSSRMSVKCWKDSDIFEFINCKSQDGLHWTTNISVEIDDEFLAAYAANDPHARKVMRQIVLGKRSNGEPGIWNISLARKGEKDPTKVYCPNPCGEICMYMWENCNLGHINMGSFAGKRPAEMYEAFRLMSRWLVRATHGDIPQPRQRKVVDENRRVGVGFLGFHEWLALNGIKYSECHSNKEVKDTLTKAFSTVRTEVDKYCKALGIPASVKCTALAPTGTSALMPGTTGSAQCMMFPWYKRLVRYASDSPELATKKAEGYETFVDPDAKNTEIVVYWCEDPLVSKVRNVGYNPEDILEGQFSISMENSLKVQAMLQTNYADNAISYTINMLPDMMPTEEEMEAQLIEALPFIKGTTLFPEKSRKNSPFQSITKEEFDAYQGQKEVMQVEDECKGACPIK